jgi:hypothetical protein
MGLTNFSSDDGNLAIPEMLLSFHYVFETLDERYSPIDELRYRYLLRSMQLTLAVFWTGESRPPFACEQ